MITSICALSVGYRKYRALSVIGYFIILSCAAFLFYLAIAIASDATAGGENVSLSVGLGYAVFLVMWIICAAIQLIPIGLGITGWVLTARNNGSASRVYVLQTFLPLVMLGLTFLAGYLAYASLPAA